MLNRGLELSDRDLATIVNLVYEKSGISLHNGKRALITARLQKRLRTGGFSSYSDYIEHVQQDDTGDELVELLDAIATNHTSFFRGDAHFRFLEDRVVEELTARKATCIRGWSAACSTGEEPFSIVITLLEAAPRLADRVSILASDLSTKALRKAKSGVFTMSAVQAVPRPILQKYFERGTGAQQGLARVTHAVRRPVEFSQLNLLEIGSLGQQFDFVFCRNVMIYFDSVVQQRVVSMLERHIVPGGYLFISHSESLNGLNHQLKWVAPAVYKRSNS